MSLFYHSFPPFTENIELAHSHKYFEQTIDGRLWLNPGSCGKRRFDQEISFALLHIDGGAWRVERIVLKQ